MGEDFDILAAKVLAGEASAEESSRLQEMLSQTDELRKEFAALEVTWQHLRAAGPLVKAMDAPPTPIPPERLRQLQQAVRGRAPGASLAAGEKASSSYGRDRQPSVCALAFFWEW